MSIKLLNGKQINDQYFQNAIFEKTNKINFLSVQKKFREKEEKFKNRKWYYIYKY